MTTRSNLACAMLVASAAGVAQPTLFSPLAGGVGTGAVYEMLADPVDTTKFYLAGGFSVVDNGTITAPQIVVWDGLGYNAIGCGLHSGTWDCVSPVPSNGSPNPIWTLAFWNGELYAGGVFDHSGTTPINNIARWDGTAWQPLLGGTDRVVWNLKAYSDGLYVAGWFEYADTVLANGLARWDGAQFHRVHNLPRIWSGDINRINDVTVYDGQVYIGGQFQDGVRNDIAYFDGNAWVGLGLGFRGSNSTVNNLEERDGKLWVAGSFNNYNTSGHPDNPGNGIVSWDGSQWDDLLGGTAGSINASVYGLEWVRDTLHIVGRFNQLGGVPSGRIAKWDGQRWCSLVPIGYFSPDVNSIGQWRDTLYAGGTFLVAGTDSMNSVGKWIGGSYTDTCSWAVGVFEAEPSDTPLLLWPNPAADVLQIANAHAAHAVLFDATGRQVMEQRISPNAALNVEHLASGCYVVLIRNDGNGTLRSARFVRE